MTDISINTTRRARNSRRAPHMERFVKIRRAARASYEIVLRVDHQTFSFPLLATNQHEARWMMHMLCIALDRMVLSEFDRRDFLKD